MQNILDMLNTEQYTDEKAIFVTEDTKKEDEEFEEVLAELNEYEVDLEGEIAEKNHKEILNLMFDDIFIKAEKSPFMTYPDDKQEFLEKANYVDFGKVIQQYRNGDIEERMLRVLDIIIHHKYISTRQIWQMYLLKYGLYIKRDSLTKILNRMAEKGLVVGFVVKSSIGEGKYHIYCADYNGVRLYTALKSENINWKRTDTIQRSYIIKRSLAKNQFLIAYLKYYDIDYNLQPKLMWTERGREVAVIPSLQLTFKLKEQLDSVVFLVEVIRKYQGWEESFLEKLIRYGKYMQSIEDTQALKKYYVVICAESPEQVTEAIQLFYTHQHVERIPELQTMELFYTYDLELLDNHYNKSLIDNLRSYEFNSEKKVWEQCHLNENFEKRDWRNIEFEIEKVQTETGANTRARFCGEIQIKDKRELAIQIYNIVKGQGWDFPQSITKLAIPLKKMGIDYKAMGYKKLSGLFENLSDYYAIYYETSTIMMIDCTEMLKAALNNGDSGQNNEVEENQEDLEQAIEKGQDEKQVIKGKRNIIVEYFSDGISSSKEWRKEFSDDIFCFRNWEMSVSLLVKMTRIYDLSKEGWLDVLAYSYHLAKNEKRLIENTSKAYICFDVGLLTFTGEKMYLLAKKNYREQPDWVLEGISTVSSRVLGEILRTEFGLS